MKKKSIIILALMVVLSVLLNYFTFFGIEIGSFKYDSLFGDNLFGVKEEVVSEDTEITDSAAEGETDAEQATNEGDEIAPTEEDAVTEDGGEETVGEDETATAETEEQKTETSAPAADNGRIRKGIELLEKDVSK